MNWALSKNNLLNIATRPLENYQIVMSQKGLKRLLLYYATIPGATALFGLMIFLIRRR
jgi:nitrate reductase gamma subunit